MHDRPTSYYDALYAERVAKLNAFRRPVSVSEFARALGLTLNASRNALERAVKRGDAKYVRQQTPEGKNAPLKYAPPRYATAPPVDSSAAPSFMRFLALTPEKPASISALELAELTGADRRSCCVFFLKAVRAGYVDYTRGVATGRPGPRERRYFRLRFED